MKTILITGSTDGIGKLAAAKLAKDGNRIIVHGRNLAKLNSAITEIKEQSSNKNITGYIADLSDPSSIEKMVAEVSNDFETIDILINNAGVFKSNARANKDGLDLRLMVNYLAPIKLTYGLMPLLKNSASPRLINLSSAAQATVSMEALLGKKSLSEQEAYAQSKLALTMWSFYLAGKEECINVIAVNPGSLLNTKMVQEAYGRFWSSADKGANILYDLATSEKYSDSSGLYFDNDNGMFAKAHQDAYNPALINELISTTDTLLDL